METWRMLESSSAYIKVADVEDMIDDYSHIPSLLLRESYYFAVVQIEYDNVHLTMSEVWSCLSDVAWGRKLQLHPAFNKINSWIISKIVG